MPLRLEIIFPDPIWLLKLRIYFKQKVFQNKTQGSDPNKSLKDLIYKSVFPTSVTMFRPNVKDALQNRRKDRTHAGSSDVTQLYGFMSKSYTSYQKTRELCHYIDSNAQSKSSLSNCLTTVTLRNLENIPFCYDSPLSLTSVSIARRCVTTVSR